MPIHTETPVRVFDQEAYHQVTRIVTGLAFDIHNEFGRYLDENLYQGELTRRCREKGLKVQPEFRMTVTLGDFSKSYFADQLVDGGVIVEDKAVAALAPIHRAQTLNYLFLCGLHHGTLLNFRTERVQREFVSTSLTTAARRQFEIVDSHWQPLTARCRQLLEILGRLLHDWGAFLDTLLYRDALTHFLGGEESVVREVGVTSGGVQIGTQKMHLLASDVAFSVTASRHRPDIVLEHHQRFLRHTSLRAIQWINFDHHRIELRTITRP